jgi:hypothetical protein
MDYIGEAVEYLKHYEKLKISKDNLRCEILELREDLKSVKPIPYSDMPHGSGSGEPDDIIINKMFRMKKAEQEYRSTSKTLKRMELVLEKFEEHESEYFKILKGYFINNDTEEQMMKDFNYTDRHIRRLKQKALREFAIQLFGINVIA